MTRTLVTGGAGFIGSHLVDALVAAGHEVTAADDLSTGRRAALDGALAAGASLAEVDIRDAEGVETAFAVARPEIVFHLAAQIDVRRSVEAPAFDAAVNVVGTVNVLEAARRHGAGRLVNTSTGGAIYGVADEVPTPETAVARPLAPYGTSKLCAEQYCSWYARLHGLSTVTLRLANVYGPRQDPLGEAGVVAILCDRLLGGASPTVFGDGLQTRDFVYVRDVVAAQVAAAESSVTGALNVGTGVATSVMDLIAAVARAGQDAGVSTRFPATEMAPPREGEVRDSCLAVVRTREELGFTAGTGLLDGLGRTLDWVGAAQRARTTTA